MRENGDDKNHPLEEREKFDKLESAVPKLSNLIDKESIALVEFTTGKLDPVYDEAVCVKDHSFFEDGVLDLRG